MTMGVLPWTLVAFLLSLCSLTAFIRRCPRRLLDFPGGRKAHSRPIPLGGGLAALSGMLPVSVAIVVEGRAGSGLLLQWGATFSIFLVGIADDLSAKSMPARTKAVATLLCLLLAIESPFLEFLLVLIPAFLLLHSFNTSDNVDGLAAGLGVISLTLLVLVDVGAGRLELARCEGALGGALCAFLFFNFPCARVFLGDGGALFIGGWFAWRLLTDREPWLLALGAVPLADLLSVSWLRVRAGSRPWVGDLRHLSHRLVTRGLSPVASVVVLWAVHALLATLSWGLCQHAGWSFTSVAVILLAAAASLRV